MNGIDALNAMKEGNIVKDEYGKYYRMECFCILYHMKYHMDGEWHRSEMDLNDWIIRDFGISSEPVAFNLTFSEAMVEAAQGSIVCSKEYPSMKYYMKDGKLCWNDDIVTGLQANEIKAKWRVVKEEEE